MAGGIIITITCTNIQQHDRNMSPWYFMQLLLLQAVLYMLSFLNSHVLYTNQFLMSICEFQCVSKAHTWLKLGVKELHSKEPPSGAVVTVVSLNDRVH